MSARLIQKCLSVATIARPIAAAVCLVARRTRSVVDFKQISLVGLQHSYCVQSTTSRTCSHIGPAVQHGCHSQRLRRQGRSLQHRCFSHWKIVFQYLLTWEASMYICARAIPHVCIICTVKKMNASWIWIFPPRYTGLAKMEDSLEPGDHGQPKNAHLICHERSLAFCVSKED